MIDWLYPIAVIAACVYAAWAIARGAGPEGGA